MAPHAQVSVDAGSWDRDRKHLVNFLKAIAKKAIGAIEPSDLLTILRSIEARGARDTAHRVRSVASRVFRYAVATGRAKCDVAGDLKGALLPLLPESYSAITEPQRLGQLLRAIDEYDGQPTTRVALA